MFTWGVINVCWVVVSVTGNDCIGCEAAWAADSSSFSSEDFSPTRLLQVNSSSLVTVSWFIVGRLLSDLSSALITVIGLVRPLSEEKISWLICSFSIVFRFKFNITVLIVSLIKSWIVSIRSWFAPVMGVSEVFCETESWISVVVSSLLEIWNSLIKRDLNLIKSVFTWDGSFVELISCSSWIWSCKYTSDPSVVNICSFSWDEVVWSAVFDTTSSIVSLIAVVGFVIVSEVVSKFKSVAVNVISSLLFWSVIVWISKID